MRCDGSTCRRCGRKHFRVIYTRPAWGGRIMRRRECRNRGMRITAGSTLVTWRYNIYVDGEFANEGTLDLVEAEFAVLYSGGPSPFDGILADLATGCNGGAWDGPGIVSSAAADDPQSLTALGVLDDGEKVVVDYCWAGDANLDGVMNSHDYDIIDRAWLLSGGAPLGGGTPTATPEPATLALPAVGGLALLRRREA